MKISFSGWAVLSCSMIPAPNQPTQIKAIAKSILKRVDLQSHRTEAIELFNLQQRQPEGTPLPPTHEAIFIKVSADVNWMKRGKFSLEYIDETKREYSKPF